MRPGKVRIIAGKWRSRKLRVADGVRPCQDAQRETLFNIYAQQILGQDCVDLFAGSGSLGFEALSRGAKKVTFVERSPKVARNLEKNIADLEAQDQAQIWRGDVSTWLRHKSDKRFGMAFVDPPYKDSAKKDWWIKMLPALESHLEDSALVLCEGPNPIDVPKGWSCLRTGKTGGAHWAALEVE